MRVFFGQPPVASAALLIQIATILLCAQPCRAGVVYVHTTHPDGDSVYGWLVDETTGRLVEVAGSPFAVTTTGASSASSDTDSLAIDDVNDRLYALSATLERIDSFTIDPATGALTPMAFGPQPSGPVGGSAGCIGVHPSGSPLVVLSGSLHRKATSYEVTPTTFTEVSSSSYPVGSRRCLFTPGGDRVYFPNRILSEIDVLEIDAGTGVLSGGLHIDPPGTPRNGLPLIDGEDRLFFPDPTVDGIRVYTLAGAVATPVAGSPFASSAESVADATELLNSGLMVLVDRLEDLVGLFRVDGTGAATIVSEVADSPYASTGESPHSLATNGDDSLLFVLNSRGPNRLAVFRVNAVEERLLEVGLLSPMAFGEDEKMLSVRYWDHDVCASAPDGDGDGVGDACDACPGVDNSADTDADGIGDCEDLCTDVGLRALDDRAKLRFKSVGTDKVLGNDRMQLKGSFHLVAPASFADIDPTANVVRVEAIDAYGGRIIEGALETTAFAGHGTAGWRVNGAGTVWKYRDKRDVHGPVTAMSLKDASNREPGLVKLKLAGKDGTFFVDAGDEPVNVSLAIGSAAAGLCAFTAYGPGDCELAGIGTTMSCRVP